MRVPAGTSRGTLGFDMTPMIDCVFQLIIFFLVSSHLAQQELQVEMNLPQAQSGQRQADDESSRRVVVNIPPDERPGGSVQVSGNTLDRGELARLIRYENDRAEGRLEVRLRCDRAVPYRVVEPILVDCARAGVWKVTFAVVKEN